jgi:hypothetical protein
MCKGSTWSIMKGLFVKQQGGKLSPMDEPTQERMQKIRFGEVIEVEFKKKRNPLFHRKFFALMQLVFENQEKYQTMEALLTEMKLQVGHYDEHVTMGGKLIYQPKSIAFDAMDDIEFSEFYDKVVDATLKFFLRDMDRAELETMVDQIIGFT